jgi:hypothetical protein
MDRNAEPDGRCSEDSFMEQWCLPLRRQHSGNWEFVLAKTTGPISEMLNRSSSSVAEPRRMDQLYSSGRRCQERFS